MPDVETRYGRLAIPDADTDVIGTFLLRYGEWAWFETEFIGSVLDDGARVLDVGAFLGTFGLGLAAARPLGFLCCVEANPAVAPLLRRNLAALAPCAATSLEALVVQPGAPPLHGASEPGNLGSMSYAEHAHEGSVPAAQTTTLAAQRAEHGAFDLVKLDIEGMERDVLNGDREHLAAGGTTLWVECNEDARSLEVAALLLSWGLPTWYFAFPSHNPGNFNHDGRTIFPWAFEAGLLAAPRRAPALSPALQAQGCILVELSGVDDLRSALWRTPRWGMAEWEGATDPAHMAALVGRSLRGQTQEAFLSEDGEPAATLWQQLETGRSGLTEERRRREAAEEALRVAEDWAAKRLRQRNAERVLHDELLARLRHAETLAADRLSALQLAQRNRRELEAQLAEVSARGLHHLAELGEARDHSAALGAAALAERELLTAGHRAQQDNLRGQSALNEQAVLDRARAEWAGLANEAAGQIGTLRAEVLAHDQRARMAEHAVQLMQASTMWRMTAPLRAVVHGVRRSGAGLRRSGPAGQRRGA